MPIANRRYFLSGMVLAVAVILFDQWSKWLLLSMIPSPASPPIEIIPVFNLVLVWNSGISFGMLSGQRQPLILIAVSAVITIILLIWLYKNKSLLTASALGFIIGGATGNVIDRWRFGAVADFFDAHIGHYHWPAFNVADSFIFIGVVVLCGSSMFMERYKGTTP